MYFLYSVSVYLDPFYPEAQGVGGAHRLPPLHVARFGDAMLGMFLGTRPFTVHLHHFLVQVLPRLGPFPRSNKLLLQVCPKKYRRMNTPLSSSGALCGMTICILKTLCAFT